MVLGKYPDPSRASGSKRLYFLRLRLNLERRWQYNLAVNLMAFLDWRLSAILDVARAILPSLHPTESGTRDSERRSFS